ncbi:hypothetical protein GQ55_2G443000 [Panicum hallii var. hallii]|uniref:Uncharacterized protein n=1 Tax=Panicum hallii var. hallii TaxID=1504633 RepID=A0A2T7EYZ3_9POAL|nr:hypothetical protein GQ55_2G443000 [Panicum hallii var. hallii]
MVTLTNLGRLYGDVVERATLSRDLLAPTAARLPGDPSGLHSRCVLAQCIGFFRRPDDVRADLAPLGDVEAVAVCGPRPAPPPRSRDRPRRGSGSTPLYPPSVPASGEASTEDRPAPNMEAAGAPQAAVESRPAIVFLYTLPNERPRTSIRGPPGAEARRGRFTSGYKLTYYEKGMQIDRASTRVIQVAPQTYYLRIKCGSCHMATPQHPSAPVNRGAPLPSYHTMQ